MHNNINSSKKHTITSKKKKTTNKQTTKYKDNGGKYANTSLYQSGDCLLKK